MVAGYDRMQIASLQLTETAAGSPFAALSCGPKQALSGREEVAVTQQIALFIVPARYRMATCASLLRERLNRESAPPSAAEEVSSALERRCCRLSSSRAHRLARNSARSSQLISTRASAARRRAERSMASHSVELRTASVAGSAPLRPTR
jgi:hypothetical protein